MDPLIAADSKPSFFSLPQSIRQRIYTDAGLAANTGLLKGSDIDLNRSFKQCQRQYDQGRHDQQLRKSRGESYRVLGPPPINYYSVTHSLLLTCRRIYIEASTLVYSANRFFIRYSGNKSLITGLDRLKNLTTTSLGHLTHLTVRLHVVEFGPGNTSCNCWLECHPRTSGPNCRQSQRHDPLRSSSPDTVVLSEWLSAARHLTAHIKPSTLSLHIVCDVENLETGQLVVQPLRGIPTLVDCSLRLHHLHRPPLQALVAEVVAQAKGQPLPSKPHDPPFRFLDLPPEIRLRCLEYTDLVTPMREVVWNPKDVFYLQQSECLLCEGMDDSPEPWHHACQFRYCREQNRRVCFCHRYHTSFSTTCRCWIPPTPLFLVCRAFKQHAEAIFFGMNHFVVSPVGGCYSPTDYTPDLLEALVFFEKAVPPPALKYLTSLEIVFPPFHDDYLTIEHPAHHQWLQAIDHMCQLNLPLLSLSIVMADGSYSRSRGIPQFRATMNKKQAKKVFDMYERTFAPLSKLKENGLEVFSATLASPFTWTVHTLFDSNHVPWHIQQPRIEAYRRKIEDQISKFTVRMERVVMGEDYDSNLVKARVHGKSQWLVGKEVHETMF
ncbi:hypothetical protein LSUE1_G003303 [Lachnellula suecica]|uniref:DUF7730 domain-containing protein n=1 Tax=Lachnellula suecica TaxID=602035 RepID=A0A8T9CDZ5_9HELO|nr:hypothetical protein LSUE1_G003303 [Lachnellula suecica]